MPLTPEQQAAGLAALNDWAAPQIAAASVFTRGAIKEYLAQHGADIVAVIGPAILAASSTQGEPT